jgi:AcrR family transcriptional regulator
MRGRIVVAAAQLLEEQGSSAVTTRGVAEAAGVQAPTIYRLFGDKDGLLEAVAEHVMATYVATKTEAAATASATGIDPIDDLRASWILQIEFGLANPAIFRLLSEPGRVAQSPAARSGRDLLEARVHRIAATGQLRVAEQRAVGLIQAGAVGAIQTLLATPLDQRDLALPEAMLEAVLAHILVNPPERNEHEPIATAVAFRALAPRLDVLTATERLMLVEWVERAIDTL